MNLNDLKAELDAKADEVTPSVGMARLAAVRGRVRARRQRQAGAVALIAAGCALAIAVVPNLVGLQTNRSTGPAKSDQQTSGGHRVVPFAFDNDLAGDPLIASVVGKAGQNVVTLHFTPKDNNLSMSMFCYLQTSSPSLWNAATVNGHPSLSTGCENSSAANQVSGGGTIFSGKSNRAFWAGMGVLPGRESVVQVRLQTEKGQLRADPSARLGVGLYEESGQRVVEDGMTIKSDAEADGHDYRLVSSETVQVSAAHQRLSFQIPAQVHPGYLMFGQSVDVSADPQAMVELSIDGKPSEANGGGGISSFPLDDARSHRYDVRTNISGGVLVLAFYQWVD